MRDTRAKPKTGFRFNVQKQPVLVSGGASLVWNTDLDTRDKSCQGLLGVHLPVPLTLRRQDTMGNSVPDVLPSKSSSLSSSSVVQAGSHSKILDQWSSIIFNTFAFNMVKGYHFS